MDNAIETFHCPSGEVIFVGNRKGAMVIQKIRPPGHRTAKNRMIECRCDCGKLRVISSRTWVRLRRMSCGCKHAEFSKLGTAESCAERRPNWGSDRRVSKDGYVWVRVGGAIVSEHRHVMEGVLGRQLNKGESVHHKNGVRDDNRPENLELWTTAPRFGQRASDMVEWAKEILRRYDNQ